MSVRYAPFATVKMMSIATMMWDDVDFRGATDLDQAFKNAVDSMIGFTAVEEQVEVFKHYYDVLFRHVGLADSININENYGTRPVYGVGEPTNPALVPGNVGVTVNISRLTTDNRSIADYAIKPAFWYDEDLQRKSINYTVGRNGKPENADRPFHVYLAISDVEHGSSLSDIAAVDLINNYEIIEFMPVSYGRRISSENSLIFTDVEGTGKVLKLKDVISELARKTL